MYKRQARAVFTNIHELNTRRFLGDIAAIDSLLDLEAAIHQAKLTNQQKTALKLVFIEGHTHESAAALLGAERSSITKSVTRALAKIEDIYEYWHHIEGTEAQAA